MVQMRSQNPGGTIRQFAIWKGCQPDIFDYIRHAPACLFVFQSYWKFGFQFKKIGFMKTKIWIALIAIYIIWGSTYLAIRYAVATIPPFLMAGTRFLVAGTILLVWRRLAGDPLPTARQWRSTAIVGLLLLLGGNGLVSWAEKNIVSGIAALIIGSVPLFMVIVEALRRGGAKPGWQPIVGLATGFGGIALLVGPSEFSGKGVQFNLLAIAALLLAALLWSIGSVYSKTAELPTSSLMGTGMEMLCGGVGLYIVGTLTGEWKTVQFAAIAPSSWIGLAYLIVFGSMMGYVAYSWLLRHAPISLVSTYAYVNPVVAILLGAWIGHEVLNARTIIAALVIISSVILINSSKQSKIVQEDETISPATD
jgi:drug/metabolite transporter (DMT)-like permease